MTCESIDDVIAVRKIFLTNGPSENKQIFVYIGRPYEDVNLGEFWCPYQIIGIGTEKVRKIAGIDAIQAIQGTLLVIGAELEGLNAACDYNLSWDGGEPGDVGFARPV